ncbi:hypothetical protein [Halobacillus sp. A5]|uniref:hypothetical protein n=1 Tax=Halobacillus sp. A5 TaxID=2880263 RepID=UPI0020A64AE7|nr:hypothetical protein [Halobacillus sp. A5]MCP3028556.1 hypothetical protein [Halobacillus sp. A5]
MFINNTSSILLPNHLRGRSLRENVIPTVSNLRNMLIKLEEVDGEVSRLKPWDKRSYAAYHLATIKEEALSASSEERIELVKNHVLQTDPAQLGANCIDIYLVAYAAETFGAGKQKFFEYIFDNEVTEKENSAQAIWQVGKGDGVYLGVLNEDGSICDWNFFAHWVKGG